MTRKKSLLCSDKLGSLVEPSVLESRALVPRDAATDASCPTA